MDPSRITLAVLTVNREPQYIHQTLTSLFVSGPLVHRLREICLVVDGADAGYLENYRHHSRLRICQLDEAEFAVTRSWSIHRRCCHGHHRCLSLPVAEGGGLCVAEDDVVFRDLFVERLAATVDEMEHDGLHDYALALTSAYDFEQDRSFYRGGRYCRYGYSFYGTQTMYYPESVVREVRDYVFRLGVATYTQPFDLLVKDLYGSRMYCCPRSLANHIGRVSTGLGGASPSPGFERPYASLTTETWGRNHEASGCPCPNARSAPDVMTKPP